MRSPIATVLAACFLFACGSTSQTQPDPVLGAPDTDTAVVEAPTETPEQKLSRQQGDAVEKACEQIVNCSLEDAKKELTPEEFAENKLDDPTLLQKANANCREAYSASMSPRQVGGIRECLSVQSSCEIFGDCFASALNPPS